jgi:hypothetical protein
MILRFNRTRLSGILLLLSLCCLGVPRAGGVSLDGVPPSAAWVVDGEARKVASLPVIRRLLRERDGGTASVLDRLQALALQGGVNPTTDVHRVQVMGLGITGTVAIVEGRWDVARLQRLAQAQPGFRKLGARGLELYRFNGRRRGEALFVHVAGRQRILVGSTASSIIAVAEALVQPGAADGVNRAFGEMTGASPGALVVLGARDGAALMELIPDAAMLLQAGTIVAQMGRLRQNLLGVHLAAQAADATGAANMATLLGGLQAMLAFRAVSDPQWVTIAQTMRIQTTGNRVIVNFSLDSDLADALLSTVLRELNRKGRL